MEDYQLFLAREGVRSWNAGVPRPCGVPARPPGALESAHAFSYEERSRAGFEMGDRKGRPYAGFVAELFGVASHAVVVSRRALRARSRVLTHSRTKNEAVLDSRWATARVAPTRA